MTDEEKREMAAVDHRARVLLERTEALTPAELGRLHGALRYPGDASTRLARTLPAKPPAPPDGVRRRIFGIFSLLTILNFGAWAWALGSFHGYPLALGTALLAYGFGLRHAVDADHIAAIDNATRKLMQEGQRPVGVGFFFSLGHSTVVVMASIAVATAATAFRGQVEELRSWGGIVGTLISAGFLLAIAIMNMFILADVFRTFREVKARGGYLGSDANPLLGGGFLARMARPLFGLIRRSWHMYPLGFLFGLGFDTATEIGLLGISAAEGSKGMPIWTILVFPALFTVGMALVDTADSVLMLRAYGWAFVKPIRKLFYNMTITFVSVIVALMVGGVETLGLIGGRLDLKGTFWDGVGRLNDNFGTLGYLIIGIFVLSWLVSLIIYRANGYDALDDETSAQ